MSAESPRGCRWFAVFVDDCNEYLFGYPLRRKSEILVAVQDVLVETASAGHKFFAFRSDNALEFRSSAVDYLLKKHLVKHQFSAPYKWLKMVGFSVRIARLWSQLGPC